MLQSIPKISIKPGYRPQSDDKTPEADAIDFYRLRQLTNSQRWQLGAKLTRWAKTVSLRGMRKAWGACQVCTRSPASEMKTESNTIAPNCGYNTH